MGLNDGLVSNFYGDIAKQIIAADPKDETGFAKKAADAKRLSDFQGALEALASKNDMDGALALVNKTIKEGGFGTEETQQMMMTRAVIYAQQTKFDEALKAVDEAIAVAPDSEMIPGIEGFKKRIEDGNKKATEGADKKEAKPVGDKE